MAILIFILLFSVYLIFFTIVSFFIMLEYLADGSASFPYPGEPCGVSVFLILIIISVVNFPIALKVNRFARSEKSVRALYIFIFYPIIFVSYMVATIDEVFQTAFILGFPLLLAGSILLPYAAIIMSNEASRVIKENIVVISCFNCRYTFEMHRRAPEQHCPLCGATNKNIFAPGIAPDELRGTFSQVNHK